MVRTIFNHLQYSSKIFTSRKTDLELENLINRILIKQKARKDNTCIESSKRRTRLKVDK